jgi:hypothetical protein
MTRYIFLLCAASLLSACSPTGVSDGDELQRNRERWEALRPASYEFSFQRSSCECLPEWTLPLRVTVEGGEIISVIDLQSGELVSAEATQALTISDLFELVQGALAQDAYQLLVTYDRSLGYPTFIRIDRHPQSVDDEVAISSGEFRAVNVNSVPLMAPPNSSGKLTTRSTRSTTNRWCLKSPRAETDSGHAPSDRFLCYL